MCKRTCRQTKIQGHRTKVAARACNRTRRQRKGRASMPRRQGPSVQMHTPTYADQEKAGLPHQGGGARTCIARAAEEKRQGLRTRRRCLRVQTHAPPKKRRGHRTKAAGPVCANARATKEKARPTHQRHTKAVGPVRAMHAPPKKKECPLHQGGGARACVGRPARANARSAKEDAGPPYQGGGLARANARAAKENAGSPHQGDGPRVQPHAPPKKGQSQRRRRAPSMKLHALAKGRGEKKGARERKQKAKRKKTTNKQFGSSLQSNPEQNLSG